MNVANIFKILIIVVACIIVGALILNVLLPNALTSMVDWMERGIYAATGASFDLNGDGNIGASASASDSDTSATDGAGVEGYDGFNNGATP